MPEHREDTPRMFHLVGSQGLRDEKKAPIPLADEATDPFADMRVSDEPPSAEETPSTEKPKKNTKFTTEDAVIAPVPGDQTIVKTATEYAENQPPKNETAGFKAAGERIRIVVPDDPTDPERVARLTQLGLRAIKTIDKNPDRPKKKGK